MKFTTFVPIKDNDGVLYGEQWLKRLILRYWLPFRGMTNEGLEEGYWTDIDDRLYMDISHKISIEADRDRLFEAIRAVKRLGRKLSQKAMYFEVSGYDGVQILHLANES